MTYARKIDERDLPKELERLQRTIRKEMGRSIRNGTRGARALLVKRSPKDLGQLKASWRNSIPKFGRRLSAESGSIAEVWNDAPHAGIVEAGARPHPVSHEGRMAIYEWVKRHFTFMRAGKRGNYAVVSKSAVTPGAKAKPRTKLAQSALGQKLMDDTMKEIADAIIRKIEKKGQAPTYFVRDSLPSIYRLMAAELEAGMKRVSAHKGGPRGNRKA